MSDNFVWTKHVEQRSYERGIGYNEVWSTLRHPEKTEKNREGSYRFYKNFAGKLVCIVAKPQGNKWVVITTFTKEKNSSAYKNYVGPRRYHQPIIQKLVFSLVVKFGRLVSRLFHKH